MTVARHLLARAERDDQSGVGAVVLEMRAALDANALGAHALAHQLLARGDRQLFRHVLEQGRVVQLRLDSALAHDPLVRESHAVRR